MAAKESKGEARPAPDALWRALTWDDLEAWAGDRSLKRGRSYQREGRVQRLARDGDTTLLAWVHGEQRYATRVDLRSEAGTPVLESQCSCPLGISGCKHAVAVVLRGGRRRDSCSWYGEGHDPRVADAVAATHPDRALEIYRDLAEGCIALTSPSAYEEARPYLKKLRALWHRLGRDDEWARYLAGLREEHGRKRRLMEVLDRLVSRPIAEG